MKKYKNYKIFTIILIFIACIFVLPFMTMAEDAIDCPSPDYYINNYLNLDGGQPFTEGDNIEIFHIKKEYLSYVSVYVNDTLVTPDANGDVVVNLNANSGGGINETTVLLEFTEKTDNKNSKCKAKREFTFTPDEELPDEPDDEETANIENEINSIQESNDLISDLVDSSFKNVTDPTNTNKLMCNYSRDDGKTVQKFTYKGVKEQTQTCLTTCREDVIVTFDPPVITQSGMCFSYVADIKTKAVCSAKFTGVKPTKIKGCIARTYCTGGSDEGGPTDSFDSCVEECDGGEYTQSCINKCYNKVYKESDTTKTANKSTNNSKDSAVKQLNELKESNSIATPMKSANLKSVAVAKTKDGETSYKCYTDEYLSNLTNAEIEAIYQDVYQSKKYLPGGYYGTSSGYEWTPTTGYFYYDVSAGTWVWKKSGGCLSKVNYYYFSSPEKTKTALQMLSGKYLSHGYFYGKYLKYEASGTIVNSKTNLYQNAGPLKMISYSATGNPPYTSRPCSKSCNVVNKCSNRVSGYAGDKKYIVTNVQGNQIYKAELTKYKNDKKKCLNSAKNTCTTTNSSYVIKTNETSKKTGNELGNSYSSGQNVNQAASGSNKNSNTGSFPTMIINTNGVCITGSCDDSKSEYCSNLDPTKNASDLVGFCKDKESCKNSGTQACKEGNTCYDYHTTISFPKNYMNVKTGQTRVEISKDKLPYFVSLGNAYCTNLSTKEVNTAWYDYKMGDTDVKPAESKITKNITAKIKNYGIFKWNFDLSCFFAIKNPTTGECNGDDCKEKKCTGTDCDGTDTPLSNAKVRSVDTTDLFPNREPRFNWSSKAKNVSNQSYKIDPESLVKEIETLGDAVYDTDKENQNLDYHIVLTPTDINNVRKYNKEKKTYNDTDNGTGVNKIAGEKVWGVTVYRSKFLDTYNNIVLKRGLLGCNNQSSVNTCATEGGK